MLQLLHSRGIADQIGKIFLLRIRFAEGGFPVKRLQDTAFIRINIQKGGAEMGSDDIGSLKGYNIRIEGLEITDDLPVINDRNRISQSAHGYDLINVVFKHNASS